MHRSLHLGTFILITINIGFGLLLIANGFNSHLLYQWGAMSGRQPAVQSLSEFPPFCLFKTNNPFLTHALTGTTLSIVRALYASFLHFSIVHLTSNMYALYELGYMFEGLNYPGLIIPVYMITGICSMLAASHFNPNSLTAGASGAIFGIMGVMLTMAAKARIGYHFHHLDYQTAANYSDISGGVFSSVVLNLIVTFTTPGISIPGHVAGLISGLLLGLIIPVRRAR